MRPIARRISTIEASMAPPALAPVLIDAESPDLGRQLIEAKATGSRVIVAHRDWERRREVVDGLDHMRADIAGFTRLAALPSREGRRSLFEDALHGATHGGARIFGPVPVTAQVFEPYAYMDE